MSDTMTAHMRRYAEQWNSQDPACMDCGGRAHWNLSGAGFSQRMCLPRFLCHRCLSGVEPVHVPVFSDPPADIPRLRYPHEPPGKGTRPWLGYEVVLYVAGNHRLYTAREFVDAHLLALPDVFRTVVEAMGHQLGDRLRDADDPKPEE
jgi:hypothetical protein